jgi:hypothetical protein
VNDDRDDQGKPDRQDPDVTRGRIPPEPSQEGSEESEQRKVAITKTTTSTRESEASLSAESWSHRR